MRREKCVYNEEIEIKKKIYYLHICKKSYYKLQISKNWEGEENWSRDMRGKMNDYRYTRVQLHKLGTC